MKIVMKKGSETILELACDDILVLIVEGLREYLEGDGTEADSVEFLFPEVPDALAHFVVAAWEGAIKKVAPERAGEVTIQHIEPKTLH